MTHGVEVVYGGACGIQNENWWRAPHMCVSEGMLVCVSHIPPPKCLALRRTAPLGMPLLLGHEHTQPRRHTPTHTHIEIQTQRHVCFKIGTG